MQPGRGDPPAPRPHLEHVQRNGCRAGGGRRLLAALFEGADVVVEMYLRGPADPALLPELVHHRGG